jgi:hypothetical protein
MRLVCTVLTNKKVSVFFVVFLWRFSARGHTQGECKNTQKSMSKTFYKKFEGQETVPLSFFS